MASQFPADRKSPVALIVEDDPDLRELSAALMEETDLRVVECVDAEAAMTFLAHEGQDVALVFSDIRLPGELDGVDLARRVKALWPHIAVVVTSGFELRRPERLPDNVTLHAEALARARRSDAGREGVRLDATSTADLTADQTTMTSSSGWAA